MEPNMDANIPLDATRKPSRLWAGLASLLTLALVGAVTAVLAQQQPAAPPAAPAAATPAPAAKITVKLVTDFDSGKLVSDLESFDPVTSTVFGEGGSST